MSDFSTGSFGGFRASRNLTGSVAAQKTYAVSASSNEAYFVGDAVTLGTSGRVRTLKAASTTAPLGVITALYKSSNGKPSPLTFAQPTGGPYLVSGQAGFAVVNVDSNQAYVVEIDKSITEADFGSAVKVTAAAPNTAVGLSGQRLTGTVTTSSDSQFQIIGFAPLEMLSTRTSAASPVLVEVKMLRSVFSGNPV